MRYIIVIFMALILALTVGTVHADGWAPPATCDDDQREIKGNRTSPCKFPAPELENIEYRVRLEYPKCHSELLFYIEDIGPMPPGYTFLGISIYEAQGHQKTLHGAEWYSGPETARRQTIHDGFIVHSGAKYDLKSYAPTHSIARTEPQTPIFAGIYIRHNQRNRAYYSNVILYPSLPGPGETANLFNACLVKLEHEAVKHEANRRATISAQELIALHQEKIQTAENEILRTQAFIAELEFREAAGVILQEIAKIRLAGKADRVKLLNEHLKRVRQSSAEFDIETSEIESIIQQYIDFNEALMSEIDGYQTKLQERINDATRDIANQQVELEALNERAREISVGDGN